MAQTDAPLPQLGVIGLGHTGSAVATRLLEAGFTVAVFDVSPLRTEPFADKAVVCDSPAALAASADVILLRFPSSEAFVQVVEQELLPGLTKGKIVIDLGATDVVQTRRLSEWLETREVWFLDAPLSGGASAAREGRLSIFAGGKKETFKRCLPLLKVLSPLGNICYCGPAGSGQVVKGVEQLALGLSAAGFLEALAYGASFGIAPAELWEALRRTPLARAGFEQTTRKVLDEGGEAVSVHYGELPYILDAAARNGQPLPVGQALLAFLKQAPPSVIERGQHIPSYWLELNRKRQGAG